MLRKSLFLSLSVFTLSSCGDEAERKVENTYRAPELQKEWRGGCEDAGILPLSASVETSFDASNFKRNLYLSADGSCATRDVEVAYSGDYKVSEANDAQKAIDAAPIDLHYKKVVVTALTEAGKTALEVANFCGQETYTINTAVDLTGNSKLTGCPLIDLPEVQYDIVSTEGDVLRFGATGVQSAPTNPQERPTELKGLTSNRK